MDRSARLANMEGRGIALSANRPVTHQQKGILGTLLYLVFWSTLCLDHAEGSTPCSQASAGYSLPVASLCYKSSASSDRVVLDGFLTYSSSITNCECTLNSSQITTVKLEALSNLHPINVNCGSSIRVQAGGSFSSINCYIFGDITVSPSQPVMLSFDKPLYGYDSNYCVFLKPDNPNALLTLNCNGDLSFPMSTQTPPSTNTPPPTTTTTTTTAPPPTTTTTTTTPAPTTTTTPVRTTTTPVSTATTPAPITTTPVPTTTTPAPITTTTTKQSTTTTTMDPTTTSTTSTASTTTLSSTKVPSTSTVTLPTTASSQSSASTSSKWSYVIPAIGGGLILIVAIVMAVCYNQRQKRSNLYHNTNGLFAYENKLNSPYSHSYMNDEGPEMTSSISASTHIKAVIVDDVRDDMSVSTNVSEGTFVRHSVRQPISNEMPAYAVVNKSLDAKNPLPDEMSAEEDLSTSQNKQATDVDVIY